MSELARSRRRTTINSVHWLGEVRYDTMEQKDQLLAGSHTELAQVITMDQENTLVQEVGDGFEILG
jgi:hypothetical protein